MAIETYPAAPVPSFNFVSTQRHRTLVSQMESAVELRRRIVRFPKHLFSLNYRYLSIANRNILHTFFTQCRSQELPFWFIDPSEDAVTKTWIDEYVGRGGPLDVVGAIAADASVYTNETVACKNATANAMTLLPAIPAVGDCYYFGALAQFDKLTVTIGTAGNWNGAVTWEYWDGDSWDALAGLADGTNAFEAAAGARDVTFTRPDDWVITAVDGVNAYWIRARVSVYVGVTTQPKGSGAVVNAHTYELHCVGGAAGTTVIYVDDVLQAGAGGDYTFVAGGGAAGADRITFDSFPAAGSLITSNFTGKLRIKGRFVTDEFAEDNQTMELVNVSAEIIEVHW